MKKANIVGAGLVGSLWAVYMAKRGYSVDLYESRPDRRKTNLPAGRSINLALSDRGWKALEGVGLADEIRKVAIPMYGRVMHAVDGSLSRQPYGLDPNQAIYSVSRGGLNERMMHLAEEHDNVRIHFEHKCNGVDLKTGEASFTDLKTGENVTANGDVLFGTDGAFSAVRKSFMKTDRFTYQQQYIDHGYKELNIPPDANGKHQMEINALHIWPRGQFMLIALPNLEGSFTCTLFLPFEGPDSFETLNTAAKAKDFFQRTFPDALALMPTFEADWDENPTSSLVIIRCFPWSKSGKVALLGDASHAIVPFYGQGMNAGFEDCTVLNALLEEKGDNWNDILPEFEAQRKKDADAIAELALQNFIEMRDLTADKDFLLQKKIEGWFSKRNPGKWMPLYSMVTFSHIPYSHAWNTGLKQDRIMKEVMASFDDIETNWENPAVEKAILERLEA